MPGSAGNGVTSNRGMNRTDHFLVEEALSGCGKFQSSKICPF